MKNREDWKETVKKGQNKIEAWRVSCLSVEELLCLQLLGYSSKQLYEDMEGERYSLKETASMSIRELDKAKRILELFLIIAKRILITSAIYEKTHRHSSMCLAIRICPTVRTMWLSLVPVLRTKMDWTWPTGLPNRWANKGISSSAAWLWVAIRPPIGAASM